MCPVGRLAEQAGAQRYVGGDVESGGRVPQDRTA